MKKYVYERFVNGEWTFADTGEGGAIVDDVRCLNCSYFMAWEFTEKPSANSIHISIIILRYFNGRVREEKKGSKMAFYAHRFPPR